MEGTHLFGCVVQSRRFLLARLLHHLVEDAVWVLQQLAGSVVCVNSSGVENLNMERTKSEDPLCVCLRCLEDISGCLCDSWKRTNQRHQVVTFQIAASFPLSEQQRCRIAALKMLIDVKLRCNVV